jgi:excisionase family DNA binding protein
LLAERAPVEPIVALAQMGGGVLWWARKRGRRCFVATRVLGIHGGWERFTMPSPFLLLTEVAEEACVPVSAVRHWIATKQLTSFRLGRRRLVRRTELDAFVANAEGSCGSGRRAKSCT